MNTWKPTISLLALVGSNLVPLIGIQWLGWDAQTILLLYWTENLVIGFYTILKLALHRVDNPMKHAAKPFAMVFFYAHFGGFCLGHAAVLISFFHIGGGLDLDALIKQYAVNLYGLATTLWQHQPHATIWPVVCLVISHGVSFVQNFILGQENRWLSTEKIMLHPYRRIGILQVALIAGGFLVFRLPGAQAPLYALVLVKIVLDVRSHFREHRNAHALDINPKQPPLRSNGSGSK